MSDVTETVSTPEPTSETKPSPLPEFASFIRDMGVRALDNVADRISKKKNDEKERKPIRKIADHWKRLSAEEKREFFEKVIKAAEVVAAVAPVAVAAIKSKKAKAKKQSAAKKTTPAKKSPSKKKA